jgi:hypothetical protein
LDPDVEAGATSDFVAVDGAHPAIARVKTAISPHPYLKPN